MVSWRMADRSPGIYPFLLILIHINILFFKIAQMETGYMSSSVLNTPALAGVAQWIECQLVNRKVISSIPGRGTCLGCGPGAQLGVCERQITD